RAIDALLRFGQSQATRVHIQGVVTNVTNDGVYVRGTGGASFVQWAGPDPIRAGAAVEADGFAALAPFRPIFRAGSMRTRNEGMPPEPVWLNLEKDDLTRFQAEL